MRRGQLTFYRSTKTCCITIPTKLPDRRPRLFGEPVGRFADRYFLNYYRDLSEVGVYALAYKFGFLLMMFPVSPLMSIWMVQRFELAGKEGYERIANQFLSWLVVITVSAGLVICLTVRDVLTVMSASAFWAAAGVVPIIVFAYFLQACSDFFNFGILHKGETQHIAYGTLLSVIVIIALSFSII